MEILKKIRATPDLVAAIGVTITTAAFLGYWFSDLFPLIEYQGWISSGPPDVVTKAGDMLVIRNGFSREFSILFCKFVWAATGGSIDAANWVQIGLIAASAGGLFLWLRRIQGPQESLFFPLVASLGLGFSLPAVEAAAWQATAHDKLSLFFVVVGFHLARANILMPLSWRSAIRTNLILTPLCFLAYNSKEAAWCLVPALLIFAAAERAGGWRESFSWKPWCTSAALLAVPLFFSILHIGLHFRFTAFGNTSGLTHIMGGQQMQNLRVFLLGFANFAPSSGSGRYLVLISGLACLLAGALVHSILRNSTRVATPLLCFLLAGAIPLSTYYSCYFYLLVPGFFFFWLIAACLDECLLVLPRAGRNPTAAVLGTLLVCLHVFNLHSPSSGFSFYQAKSLNARNFRASLHDIVSRHPMDDRTLLSLCYPENIFYAYQIIGAEGNRHLAFFIFPEERHNARNLSRYDAMIRNAPYVPGQSDLPSDGNRLVYDKDFNLLPATTRK